MLARVERYFILDLMMYSGADILLDTDSILLLSWACITNSLGGLTTNIYFTQSWKLGSPRSRCLQIRCLQIRCLVRTCFLVCRLLSSHCTCCMVEREQKRRQGLISLLIRALGFHLGGLIFMTKLPPKDPTS